MNIKNIFVGDSNTDMKWSSDGGGMIPIDALVSEGAEWMADHGKALTILASSSAILSIASSALLIYLIFASRTRLATTYHRLLFGVSITDVMFSIGHANFHAWTPSDLGYMVYGARGSELSCNAVGFILFASQYRGMMYCSSMNLFHVAVVSYGKSKQFVRARMEPLLQGLPVVISLAVCITLVFSGNINAGDGGTCNAPVYDPPHCEGVEDGLVRDGFDIPCGRGRDGALTLYIVVYFILAAGSMLIIGISTWMMHRSVNGQLMRGGGEEGSIEGKNDEALPNGEIVVEEEYRVNMMDKTASAESDERVRRTCLQLALSCLNRVCGKKSTSEDCVEEEDEVDNRVLMRRAMAFSASFFITWSWWIVEVVLWLTDSPKPLALDYISAFFTPLQGLFNLMIFMYPQVVKAKRRSQGGDISLLLAITAVLFPWLSKEKSRMGVDNIGYKFSDTDEEESEGGSKDDAVDDKRKDGEEQAGCSLGVLSHLVACSDVPLPEDGQEQKGSHTAGDAIIQSETDLVEEEAKEGGPAPFEDIDQVVSRSDKTEVASEEVAGIEREGWDPCHLSLALC